MIVQLTGDQAAARWQEIRRGLSASLPPLIDGNEARMSFILSGILNDRMQLWQAEREGSPVAYALTIITIEPVLGTRNLLIYALYSNGNAGMLLFEEGMDALTKYARANKCKNVIAYTRQEEVVALIKRLQGNVEYFIYREVPK